MCNLKISYLLSIIIVFSYNYTPSDGTQCEMAQVCITDLECRAGEQLEPGSSVFGCCPSCQPITGEETGCRHPASCLPDGSYAPVQCKGDLFSGRCFCSDKYGNRIFGQTWRAETTQMTCACSRRRSELLAENRLVSLHCTSTGDYEPLQCDSGMCWCAEPSTGQPTVAPLPHEDMTHLPCYSATQLGEQYLRRCESTVHAVAAIHREQTEHGTTFLDTPTTVCDYDGSYGAYQISGGIAYCTGRDGNILGSWQVPLSEMTNMNCNCARDTAVYFPERGMTVSEVCQSNGSYQPNQIAGDRHYCVDSDGYVTDHGFADDWPEGGCPVV